MRDKPIGDYIEALSWSESFNTSVPKIDVQHKRLVRLLNQLEVALCHQSDMPMAENIFNELAEYAKYHFQTEENVWHQNFQGDAWEEEHKHKHDDFITDVLKLKGDGSANPLDKMVDVVSFLTQWLTFHILNEDRRMALAVLAIQSGMSLEQAKKHADEIIIKLFKEQIKNLLAMQSANRREIVRFIGEIKKLNGDLMETEERFLQLANNVNVVFWLTSADGMDVIYASPAYEKIWGVPVEKLYENPNEWMSLIHPDDKKNVKQAWTNALVANKSYKVEYRIVRADGTIHHIRDIRSPVRNAKGEIFRFAGIAEDITERKQAEATIEKVHQQLIISQKLAGIGQLTDGVCHEILNPLNIISLQVQMLSRKRNGDPDLMGYMEKIQKQIQRVTKITDALLLFSHGGSEECQSVQIEAELHSLLALIENDYKLCNICIVRDFEPGLPELHLNTEEIRQAFLNILSNAKDAMPEGGTLTISAGKVHENAGEFVRVRFSDTGVGIKKENLDKIFNPFFSSKEGGSGMETGMGLTVAHSMIEKTGGTLRVESEEGQGATFICDIPV